MAYGGTQEEQRAKHAAYTRKWRKANPGAYDRNKDISRSIAGVNKRRGRLIPESCWCGATEVEMHHWDYSKPLDVLWICRPCHLELHRVEKEIMAG